MEFLAAWLLFALIVGFVASSLKRSGILWFLLACVFSPLIMGIFLLLVGSAEDKRLRDETGSLITPDTHVRCPDCRELVRKDARKCKHCGTALIPQ